MEGAAPSDAVAVTFCAFHPLGWTANIPGFGLLAEDFPDPALHIWDYEASLSKPAAFAPMGQVALKPFVGKIWLGTCRTGPSQRGAAASGGRQS